MSSKYSVFIVLIVLYVWWCHRARAAVSPQAGSAGNTGTSTVPGRTGSLVSGPGNNKSGFWGANPPRAIISYPPIFSSAV